MFLAHTTAGRPAGDLQRSTTDAVSSELQADPMVNPPYRAGQFDVPLPNRSMPETETLRLCCEWVIYTLAASGEALSAIEVAPQGSTLAGNDNTKLWPVRYWTGPPGRSPAVRYSR